jgi:arginyl-tRNA synthetase
MKMSVAALAFLFSFSAFSDANQPKTCVQVLSQASGLAASVPTDPARSEAQRLLASVLTERAPDFDVASIASLFTEPPNPEMGQIAFPCFQLAKVLRQAPARIAETLATEINTHHEKHWILRAQAVAGYVNFHVDLQKLLLFVDSEITAGRFFAPKVRADHREKISLEFSQPNTHKALHVGHMRNMFLGESVARIIEYFGHQVVRSTYPGDMGTHVAKALWYIQTFKKREIPADPSAVWLGKMYSEADEYIKAHPDDLDIKRGISEMLKALESGDGEMFRFYRMTREWSLAEMRAVYDWLNIKFDHWYCESECDLPSRELVQKKLNEGILIKNDGAVGLDLSHEGLGFALMLKSDGSGVYLTKDLELIRNKFSDPEITRSIVVVDARQKLHFQQVFRASELMGFEKAKNSIHLAYETVNDGEGKALSSRSLNSSLGLWDLKRHIEESVRNSQAMDRTPEQLGVDNLRYGFLKSAPNAAIRFDLEQWLQPEGDTAANFVATVGRLKKIAQSTFAQKQLNRQDEQIIVSVAKFNQAAARAMQNLDPSEITRFLNELNMMMRRWDPDASGDATAIARMASEAIIMSMRLLGSDF